MDVESAAFVTAPDPVRARIRPRKHCQDAAPVRGQEGRADRDPVHHAGAEHSAARAVCRPEDHQARGQGQGLHIFGLLSGAVSDLSGADSDSSEAAAIGGGSGGDWRRQRRRRQRRERRPQWRQRQRWRRRAEAVEAAEEVEAEALDAAATIGGSGGGSVGDHRRQQGRRRRRRRGQRQRS